MASVSQTPTRSFGDYMEAAKGLRPLLEAEADVSLEGPHTHFLPKLLKAKRTHALTTPIPSGLVPCLMLYP